MNFKSKRIFPILTAISISINPLIGFAGDGSDKTDISANIASSKLRSDYQSADPYIRQILNEHEALFPNALRYSDIFFYTDLKRVSRVQQAVLTEFMAMPSFSTDSTNREPMTDLTVTVNTSSNLGDMAVLDENKWTDYLWNVGSRIRDVLKLGSLDTVEPKHIEKMLENLAEVEKLSPDADSFDRRLFGRKIAAIVFADAVLQENPGIKSEELIDEVRHLEIGALDYLNDENSYQALVDKFVEKKIDEPAPEVSSEASNGLISAITGILSSPFRGREKSYIRKSELASEIKNVYTGLTNYLYQKSTPVRLKVGDKITIKEVHPNVSIFRGYVGNDCSTSFSPGYVFTPFDRYYYIFDENNRSMGYVGISIVKLDGKKVLYMHTIQGPNLTGEQVQMVMRGFQKVAQSFGAAAVLLSKDRNIESNVNFEPIRSAMKKAVKDKPLLPVQWEDQKYRDIISKWGSTEEYDDPKKNEVGRLVEFTDNEIIDVEVHQYPFEPVFLQPGKIDFTPKSVSRSGGDFGYSSDYTSSSGWGYSSNYSSGYSSAGGSASGATTSKSSAEKSDKAEVIPIKKNGKSGKKKKKNKRKPGCIPALERDVD
jgi:hypothetical protein